MRALLPTPIVVLAALLVGCPRSSQGETPDQKAAAPVASVAPSAAPSSVPSARRGELVTGYYGFAPPRSWIEVGPPSMTKQEPRYELPRPSGKEPVVALEHRRVTTQSDAGSAAAEAIQGWKKRFGPVAERSITERTQPIVREASGRAGSLGADGGVAGEARVVRLEHVQGGRAILAGLVDLSAVDARTRGAYARVVAAYFEIEGPEATVLAARADFDAMVRSVTLGD